jgi:hypothetical protein
MSEIKQIVRSIKASRSRCLVVTCISCDTPDFSKESPFGCANCGMLDWLSAFETEEECNREYKKEHPNEFDSNGKYIG